MDYHSTIDERYSRTSNRERDIPSFIEPRPPLILNPFMRPRPQKATNLLEQFYEDSIEEEAPELVQVYLRLKPSNLKSNLYEVRSDQCLITSVDTATAGHGRRTQHNVSKVYKFSHIFGPDANQKDIFEHVVKDNLRKLPDGHNFTLLAYGASGSGKTYTLMGTVKAPGLVPRSLEYVFKVVDAAQNPLYHPGENGACKLSVMQQEHELQWVRHLRQVSAPLREKYRRMSTRLIGDMTKSTLDLSARTKHYVWVSFVEIYNEAIYDLLVTADRTAASKLRIREDANGNVFVKGATQAFVRTGEEAYDILVAGKHNLQVHATGVHAHSSRSHCIFTITMLTDTDNGVRSSYVRLCDLAGSERARRTRNTGARMQESRAINTSLHVLERCLHTLRRKQARAQDLVPYRESKLTRLLGAGLSGTRGEAVSMVVTLNPAPEYAHETRHVLQLAAVARDIQVNNTIAESISTLDSSCGISDTTLASSTELTRLRADNERLHYELMQAQSLNAKLMADMADKQEKNALTLKELVDEARDIEKQYYTAHITSLQERHNAEIAELREEYEASVSKKNNSDGTPSRSLQKKIVQLMKQITILEEALSAERLAKARMDKELQHLRTCIEERDEKSSDSKEDTIQLTDEDSSDSEEDDLINESLEPTFKKEDINRSRLIRRQSTLNSTQNNTFDKTIDQVDEIPIDKETSVSMDQNDDTYVDESNQSIDCPNTVKKASKERESRETFSVEKDDSKHSVRETYFVRDSKISVDEDDSKMEEKNQTDNNVSKKIDNNSKDIENIVESYVMIEKPLKPIVKQIDKIKQFARTTARDSSFSLTQFELLEQEANNYQNIDSKAKYFDDDKSGTIPSPQKTKEKKLYFDNIETNIKHDKVKDLMKKQDLLRSPSIVHDEIPEDYEPTTINKIIRESFTKNDIAPAFNKSKLLLKSTESFDMFEESPCHNKIDIAEQARESIESITLDDKKDKKIEPNVVTEVIQKSIQSEESPCENDNHLETIEKGRESIQKVLENNQDEVIQPGAKVVEESASNANIKDATDLSYLKVTIKQEMEDYEEWSSVKEHPESKSEKNHELIKVKLENEEIKVESEEAIAPEINETSNIQQVAQENTLDAFDDIYKNVSVPRATEFELLVSDKSNATNNTTGVPEIQNNQGIIEKEASKAPEIQNNEVITEKETKEASEKQNEQADKDGVKYNLRHKTHANDDELVENAKSAPKTAKKSLRLRRQKNKTDEEDKLKDIVNLQKEFSDVTLDVPVPVKETKDIPSPEQSETENLPPMMGVQSCPSKSVTRSRRKLFTPRAEPLEEAPAQAESGERVRVPRPSYHRPRTRRRLN